MAGKIINLAKFRTDHQRLGGKIRDRIAQHVEAMVEKEDNVYPMIPAGAAVSEMVLGPPRKRMEKCLTTKTMCSIRKPKRL